MTLIPLLILHNQLAQTKFGRCKQQMTLYMFGQYHGVLPAIYNQLYGKCSVAVLAGLR